MRRLLRLLIGTVFLFANIAYSQNGNFKITTENYPPFNYSLDGKLTGCSVDIMREILKRIGNKSSIKLTDWDTAYNTALHDHNGVCFSVSRTKDREPLFNWVGPLWINRWAFFASKKNEIKIKSLDDARTLRVGTYFNDVCETFLYDHGFDKIDCVNEDRLNAKRLVDGDIDLWIVADVNSAGIMARQVGIDPNLIVPVYTIQEVPLYIALNRKIKGATVQKFQDALDGMKKDGTYKKIISKYFDEEGEKRLEVKAIMPKRVPLTLSVMETTITRLKALAKENGKTLKEYCESLLDNYPKKP